METKIAIIIPTYNEIQNIKTLLTKIYALDIANLQIIVVDDNSPDGTADVVRSFFNKTILICRPNKQGIGSAYIAGFKKALSINANLIMEMDADLSHDPDDILRLTTACINGADMAIGSRKIPGGKIIGWGWARKFMSNGAMWFSRYVLKLKTHDVTAGFRCFTNKVLEQIDLDSIHSNGYAFQEEILFRVEKLGFNVKEIAVNFIDRSEGKSKLSTKDIIDFFLTILRLKLKP